MLLLVAGIAGLFLWKTAQAEFYFKQAQREQRELQAYVDLTTETYRFFRQLEDALLVEELGEVQAPISAPTRTRDLLEQLRELETAEIDIEMKLDSRSDEAIRKEGKRELQRLNDIESLINEGTGVSRAVMALQKGRRENAALGELRTVVRQKFDGKFPQLIDDALDYERAEAADLAASFATRMRVSTMMALWTVLVAIGFIVAIGIMVAKSIGTIDVVLQGTKRLAKGDLSHRIHLAGRGELSHVPLSFNTMAGELERQRAQLLESNANLEQEVEKRTAELESANRALRKIDEARRQFFADISHQLRTPLTVMLGEAEVALRGGQKTARDYEAALGKILELVHQLSDLVSDLLFLARSETATLQPNPRKIALDGLLADVSDVSTTLAQRRDIVVQMSMDGDDFSVRGDQQGLGRLFLCIMENAVHYSDNGGSIEIALKRDQQSVVAAISDSGPGIPEAEVDRVFERFYRSERGRQRAPSGSGLGLALAKSIVDAHHGEISVSSRWGVGTTVAVRLPYAM